MKGNAKTSLAGQCWVCTASTPSENISTLHLSNHVTALPTLFLFDFHPSGPDPCVMAVCFLQLHRPPTIAYPSSFLVHGQLARSNPLGIRGSCFGM
ncbi:hypothetical protein CRG98_009209 [Punica granatum]|uniref:Uncharacterized protein n=1 Tax=Punica granatum TaxID=22663 RepID=A0A2I0KPI0_PUNGR|nr:hypothetical protein CRG98_009209 [Punica granatum]